MVVGKVNSDQRAARGRELGLLRCPACLLIRDLTPKGLTCTLSRCPRSFVYLDTVEPRGAAGVPVKPEAT